MHGRLRERGSMRLAGLFILAAAPIFGQTPVCNPSPGECLQGYITVTRQPGTVPGFTPPFLWVRARDLNNGSATYPVRLCIDVAYPWWCPAGYPNSVTINANTSATGDARNNDFWTIPETV